MESKTGWLKLKSKSDSSASLPAIGKNIHSLASNSTSFSSFDLNCLKSDQNVVVAYFAALCIAFTLNTSSRKGMASACP